MGVWKYITDMVYYSSSPSTHESSPLLNEVPARQEDEEAKAEEQLKEEVTDHTLVGSCDDSAKSVEEVSRLLTELNSDDEELNHQVLRFSLNISSHGLPPNVSNKELICHESYRRYQSGENLSPTSTAPVTNPDPVRLLRPKNLWMFAIALVLVLCMFTLLPLSHTLVGPLPKPIGSYKIFEVQEGEAFWDYYDFYEGPDSLGSNGYINYVSKDMAFNLGIAKVTQETVDYWPNNSVLENERYTAANEKQPFIIMNSSPTEDGPRNSIRLEGKTRFNRGLFIIDLAHMPSGCATWPAFWMSDEENWPDNGEIDILEGVNFQTEAKTALHSTEMCDMTDVPDGVKTGTWDDSTGVPDQYTGMPDMTPRVARDCYVYAPHQWLNQGCVAVNDEKGTIGEPFNAKGGGVYVLEWDPTNGYIRSWAFTPHSDVPDNLRDAINTAGLNNELERVTPDPDLWGLPFGHFPIGNGTNCASDHFGNMRIIFNLAFCGSVAGNRFKMDCPNESQVFATCDDYIRSNPEALKEAYWKIRGVYVYERSWERE